MTPPPALPGRWRSQGPFQERAMQNNKTVKKTDKKVLRPWLVDVAIEHIR